jgi:rubrerythrin
MDKTSELLHQAYTGEAKAVLRLKVYAERAEKEGYPQIARLFRVIAASEEVHGTRALKLLREIKDTEANLAASFESETKVAGVAYDQFIRQAEADGNKAAALHFSQSRDVEEIHAKLYKEAMNDLMEDRETTYYVCLVCGYVSDGSLPDECPVCAAKKEQFRLVE